ncbi:hypothetical protein C8Q73DRAFT_655707 [Cubamyces lactineus]|nr:hypothetical protein C8Q73DRAFT_655707 [Cubamyces lactineus]
MPTLRQNFLPNHPDIIHVHHMKLEDMRTVTDRILCDEGPSVCGVSIRMSKESDGIYAIAFATATDVFSVTLGGEHLKNHARAWLVRILSNEYCTLAGFSMARLALTLYRQGNIHVRGVDLSTLFAIDSAKPQSPADFASSRIHPDARAEKIHALWYGDSIEDMCLRAWLSAVLAEDSIDEIYNALKVNTSLLAHSHLVCLSQLLWNVELLEGERPTQMENEFDGVEEGEDGQLVIRNARYNTRVRRSGQTRVIMENEHGHSVIGRAVRSEGKQTGIKVTSGSVRVGAIARIRVVGREELTHSELARDQFLLHLLQGIHHSLDQSPYINMFWFETEKMRPKMSHTLAVKGMVTWFPLNESQKEVVAAMRSDNEPLVVVHGPPGTGKTSTIAAALDLWDEEGSPAWVIAQSNVGVKNIARTLVKRGIDFRLFVSKEFYVEWHEHLYEEIEERLIRSDELFADPMDAERKLAGAQVILCTIAMLSNPAIDRCGIFKLVPVERLIVDEASQIDTFEFMHLFYKFRDLQKLCMFGDPKQLPPYGKETAPGLKTIYDFKQFKAAAYFLNTQYRMPLPLGEFISEYVYNSKLRSVHRITDHSAVCFVDVRKGCEGRVGSSWKVRGAVCCVAQTSYSYIPSHGRRIPRRHELWSALSRTTTASRSSVSSRRTMRNALKS